MNKYSNIFLTTLLLALSMSASPALAYIGPGLGVVAIWSLLGPIAGVIALVLLIAYFPARYYYKKHKHNKAEADKGAGDAKDAKPEAAEVNASDEDGIEKN